MPRESGMYDTVTYEPLHNSVVTLWGALSEGVANTVMKSLTDLTPTQIDFVEAVCTTSNANTITMPEVFQTGINFGSQAGVIVGIALIFGIALLVKAFDTISSTAGGGGGKKYLFGGFLFVIGGVLMYTIPNITAQAVDGGGACFSGSGGEAEAAMVIPPQFVDTLTIALTALV